MKIGLLVGARPNYMKIAPLYRILAARRPDWDLLLVHTGQHYDEKMSDIFFRELGLPAPDVFLGVGSGSHGEQTARVMMALEPVLIEHAPDIFIVAGDVNSTLAGALVAIKLGIPTAHVEAGLRSRDRAMPEEINRLATDAIADILFTTCRDADANLLAEGHAKDTIHFVGNLMVDSLSAFLEQSKASDVLAQLGLKPGAYLCVTLHRPSNVDEPERLKELLDTLNAIAADMPVVFPAHPRTQARITASGWRPDDNSKCRIVEPLGYLDFLRLMANSAAVLTDSGGIQEETTYLGIPCLTVRENTERPITVTEGTNRLVTCEKDTILTSLHEALRARPEQPPTIELWDGKAAERIATVLEGRAQE